MASSSANIFSFPTYSNDKKNSNGNYDYSDSDCSEDSFDEYSNQEIDQLDKLDRPKISKTGSVIPNTTKDYEAAKAYKHSKRLERQHQQQQQQQTLEDQNDSNTTCVFDLITNGRKLTKSEKDAITNEETSSKDKLISSAKVVKRIIYDEKLKDKIDEFVISYQCNGTDKINSCPLKNFDRIPCRNNITEIKYGKDNQIVWCKADKIYDSDFSFLSE
ncbi:hypothetical protein RB653_007520 [Dictyostelium firmibasis]|uniref:Uncharacterized protein n=1 Tax=Dictyostelium firmibasis TaxID=79012 RepID=A0AAN7YM37_9MYCE